MRIYNVSKENSLKSFIFDIVFILFITLFPLTACIFDMNILTFSALFIMIIIDIIYCINLIRKRTEYNKSENYHNLLYYIDFEPVYMNICGKDTEGNYKYIVFEYSKIKGINIILETYDSSTTRKHYTGIRDISVQIHTEDENVYTLHSFHLTFGGNLKTIYKIIDYCKNVKKFGYKINGTGDHSEIKEKLDFYIKNNKRLHVEPSGRKDLKLLAIIFFIWGCAVSMVSLLPVVGYKPTIISCITFALISYLIYFPVILDRKNEKELDNN